MKPTLKYAAAALFFVVASCALFSVRTDSIRADSITPAAIKVCARHDAYVRADLGLADFAKQEAFDESAALLSALSNPIDGEIFVGLIEENALHVSARHDAYVRVDVNLLQVERDTYLRTTELIRAVIYQATAGARASSPTPN